MELPTAGGIDSDIDVDSRWRHQKPDVGHAIVFMSLLLKFINVWHQKWPIKHSLLQSELWTAMEISSFLQVTAPN